MQAKHAKDLTGITRAKSLSFQILGQIISAKARSRRNPKEYLQTYNWA